MSLAGVHRPLGGLADVSRRDEVGVAAAEIDHVDALAGQRAGLVRDGERGGLVDLADAGGEAHGGPPDAVRRTGMPPGVARQRPDRAGLGYSTTVEWASGGAGKRDTAIAPARSRSAGAGTADAFKTRW